VPDLKLPYLSPSLTTKPFKMKKAILLFLLLTVSKAVCFGQNLKSDSLTNEFKYDTVYKSPSIKDAIYSKIKIWADTYFVSSKAAIQVDDKDLGEIFINSSFHVKYSYENSTGNDSRVFYKCKIYIKDYKIRVIVTSFGIDNFNNIAELIKLRPHSFLSVALEASDIEFKNLLSSINKTINGKLESDF